MARTSAWTKKELLGDGVVTGYGQVDGRLVFAFAQDFTVSGGSLGEYHAEKIVKVQNMALKMGAPIVGLQDSGGARVEEGVAALSGFGKIFHNNTNFFRRDSADLCDHGTLQQAVRYIPLLSRTSYSW